MKVFILALDGLEYNLVLKWKLKNLIQKKFGWFRVGDEYKIQKSTTSVPYTPIVWTSFLTGVHPSIHGIKRLYTYGKFFEFVRNLPLIRSVKGKRKIFQKLGVRYRLVNKKDLANKTIFDVVSPSIAVYFVCYNNPTWLWRKIQKVAQGLGKRYSIEDLDAVIWEGYRIRKSEVFRRLDDNWVLFGAYFEIADRMGHLHIAKRPLKLMKVYLELNRLAGELKKRLPDDIVFLIISDHGMEVSEDGVSGNHSERAFYSFNVNEDWEPKDFTDYYPKILEWINR